MFVFNILHDLLQKLALCSQKIHFLESLKATHIRASNIVTKTKHSFKQSGESLTINPLSGSICTQFMWGMKSGVLVLLGLAFYGSTTEKNFFHTKTAESFHFTAAQPNPENRSQLWNQLLIDSSRPPLLTLGVFFHTRCKTKYKNIVVRYCSSEEKLKSLNRGKLKSEGKY